MLVDTKSDPGSWEEEMKHMPWWVRAHVYEYPPTDCPDCTNCGCHVKTETAEVEVIELSTD